MFHILYTSLVAVLVMAATLIPVKADNSVALFNGKDLSGWHTRDKGTWRVEEGALTGGSLKHIVPRNSFLISDQRYQNFDLTLKIRLLGHEGFVNSGVQVRSSEGPEGYRMIGYQVDVGDGWWGKLYDEDRRRKVIGQSEDMMAVEQTVVKDGWNVYRIR